MAVLAIATYPTLPEHFSIPCPNLAGGNLTPNNNLRRYLFKLAARSLKKKNSPKFGKNKLGTTKVQLCLFLM